MDLLKLYALSLCGTPYIWGGATPNPGLDCSGCVQLILAAAGIDPPGDQTAQALYDALEANSTHGLMNLGSLAFFGKSVRQISHIGFILDPYRMVHAGGGDSTCTTPAAAAKKGAFVKVTLIKYRSDLVATLKPSYVKIGVM